MDYLTLRLTSISVTLFVVTIRTCFFITLHTLDSLLSIVHNIFALNFVDSKKKMSSTARNTIILIGIFVFMLQNVAGFEADYDCTRGAFQMPNAAADCFCK